MSKNFKSHLNSLYLQFLIIDDLIDTINPTNMHTIKNKLKHEIKILKKHIQFINLDVNDL